MPPQLQLSRIIALLLATCVAVAALPSATAEAADIVQTKTCTSGTTVWTFKATWGTTYRAGDGADRIRLKVGWTADVGAINSAWWAKSTNSDATVQQNHSAHGFFDYGHGRRYQEFDVADPASPRAKVRVGAGHYNDGVPDCGVNFAAPGASSVAEPPAGAPPVVAAPASGPKVLFEDNFNGPAGSLPDQSKWRDFSTCTSPPMGFGQIKCGDNETLTGTGQLSIPATPTAGSGLTTAGRFSFTYGTASAWIKTPKTTGYWPAFWTENRPADFHAVPLFAEVDILELYTWEPQYAHTGGIHAWGTNRQLWGGTDNYCTEPGVQNFGDAFHKYSVKFEPDRVTGYIDDVQCGPVILKSSDPAKPWPFAPDVQLTNYLILDLAIGGAGGRQPTPPRADAMLVDRVEVTSLTN